MVCCTPAFSPEGYSRHRENESKGGTNMFRKKFFVLVAVIAAFALLFTACGADNKDTPASEQSGAEVLNLASWELSATTWSSPNGATVNLTATPAGYAEGQSAAFIVRLEGEEAANMPCTYENGVYTASADLNGADGYCYYVLLTGSDGAQAEIAVNVPTDPIDESLINMASALESFCSLVVESFEFDGKWLSITGGTLQIQVPRIVNAGESITCSDVTLILDRNGEEVSRTALDMPAERSEDGSYTLAMTDIAFEVPALEDDQQLSVRLEVTLSNGQILSAAGGTWFYNAGSLLMGAG